MINSIMKFIEDNVYWLCLFVGLGGILGYIAGFKKGGRITILSILIYWVVCAVCVK